MKFIFTPPQLSAYKNDDDKDADKWNNNRREVSKFFLNAKNLCCERLIEKRLLAKMIEVAGFQLYTTLVVSLDKTLNFDILDKKNYDDSTERFCREFLQTQFKKTPR